jgi:hypothetical protein
MRRPKSSCEPVRCVECGTTFGAATSAGTAIPAMVRIAAMATTRLISAGYAVAARSAAARQSTTAPRPVTPVIAVPAARPVKPRNCAACGVHAASLARADLQQRLPTGALSRASNEAIGRASSQPCPCDKSPQPPLTCPGPNASQCLSRNPWTSSRWMIIIDRTVAAFSAAA